MQKKIKELVSGDNLDLTGNSIKNADYIQTSNLAGIVTATKFKGDGSELDNLPPSGSSSCSASGILVDGSTVIVNTDGTVSAVAVTGSSDPSAASSTEFVANSITMVHSVFVPSTNQVVVVYRNSNGNGESVVGTVSGTSITFGTPAEFTSWDNESRFSARGLFYDSITENIILHWGLKSTNMSYYDGDDRLLSAKLGSGNTLNWSTGMSQGIYGFEFYGNYCRVGDLDGNPTTGVFHTITRRDQNSGITGEYNIRQWTISADGNTVSAHGNDTIGNITGGYKVNT